MSGVLEMWTVYDHPNDFPDEFVARLYVVGDGYAGATSTFLRGATLEAVRAQLPAHLVNLGRQPGDDPKIIETWL